MQLQRALRIAALSTIAACVTTTAMAQTTTVVIDGRSYEIDDDRPLVTRADGTPGYADDPSTTTTVTSVRATSENDSLAIAMSSVEGTGMRTDATTAASAGGSSRIVADAAPIQTGYAVGTTPTHADIVPVTIRRSWPVGLSIPARTADGSYMTPNRGLSRPASVWHMRVALNVAALGCRGYGSERLVTGYNAMLARHRRELAAAQNGLAREYGVGRGRSRARYDDSMTRLYNFWATPPAQEGFCRAAVETMDALVAHDAAKADLSAFCSANLPRLDEPFVAFFREYDAWRSGGASATTSVSSERTTVGTAGGGTYASNPSAFTPIGRHR